IRSLLGDDDEGPLRGQVEVDETLYGGKPRAKHRAAWAGMDRSQRRQAASRFAANKTTVFGMIERGGRVRARVVDNRTRDVLQEQMVTHILPESMIYTDEWSAYRTVGEKFAGHKRVRHKAHVYVDGDASTNLIEGFFGLLKNGIRGVYHSVSTTYLQDYLNEYAFRFNRRDGREPLFWAILDRVQKRPPGLAGS
ncbi:MAG TPA: IS1595 family transposase, partial [Actinomycetota bacterium]|nr:IS1595 family transposase [Actinomycetota bacterium]